MLKQLLVATFGVLTLGAFVPQPAQATASLAHFGVEVVESAKQHLGMPYVWGGESPRVGFDCSGLVKYTFNEFNVSLPHRADLQYAYGQPVAIKDLEKGDIVFFRSGGNWIGHVGIYVGSNKFIHAPRRGKPIQIDNLTNGWYRNHFVGARRITPQFF